MQRLLRRAISGVAGRRESSEDVGKNNQKLEYTCMKSSKNKEISFIKNDSKLCIKSIIKNVS